jgi:hypothetical protein
MECIEVRDCLADLHRGRLSPGVEEAVRAHAAACPTCGELSRTEEALHALIRAQAPRHAAPPALRGRVGRALHGAERPASVGRGAWMRARPWQVAAIVAAATLAVVWAGGSWFALDPVTRLVAQAVVEHAEYVQEAKDRPVPDPRGLLDRLRSEAAFPLGSVFPGDAEAPLIWATPLELRGKPAVALVYRNAPGRYTTLLLMPGVDAVIPSEGRWAVETYAPHHRVSSGRQVLYWKQRDLACMLVSDLDRDVLVAMFLKIRRADDPASAAHGPMRQGVAGEASRRPVPSGEACQRICDSSRAST